MLLLRLLLLLLQENLLLPLDHQLLGLLLDEELLLRLWRRSILLLLLLLRHLMRILERHWGQARLVELQRLRRRLSLLLLHHIVLREHRLLLLIHRLLLLLRRVLPSHGHGRIADRTRLVAVVVHLPDESVRSGKLLLMGELSQVSLLQVLLHDFLIHQNLLLLLQLVRLELRWIHLMLLLLFHAKLLLWKGRGGVIGCHLQGRSFQFVLLHHLLELLELLISGTALGLAREQQEGSHAWRGKVSTCAA